MANLFRFEVYTPHRLFFADSVEAIVLTLMDGEAAIYAKHSTFSAPVSPCLLKIKNKGGAWRTAFTAEGVLEVTNHKTVLISDSTEWPEEIDYERAKKAKEKAESALERGTLKFEKESTVSSLRRAQYRMKACELEHQKPV